ncbi:hypothetical protein SLS53_001387 [Cytospora paraplurivora]|uniref:Peptidase A1 domain-containing protein n=1 Tax=Cytospora paraplurivora TaxID=2898453 RepID=A0AAN9UT80_9PEZI
MRVSTTTTLTTKHAIGLCFAFLASVVYGLPSILPRNHDGLGSYTLNTKPNPTFKGRNGTGAYLKAMAKYAHLADSGSDKAASLVGSLTGFAEADDREWLCPVAIGTPGQIVNLDLDTGSADLSASGNVYTDNVQLGDLLVKNATVETATQWSSNLIEDDAPLSGLMGLAINLSTTIRPHVQGVTNGILSQLKNQGIGSITVDLQYHNDGTFTFGGANASSAYDSQMLYQPVLPGKGYWEIEMTSVRYADSDEVLIHSWPTIVDTGTSLMLMSSDDLVKQYYDLVDSATYSVEDYGYVFNCNETLPDFHFGFTDDWAEYTVPGRYMNYSTAPEMGEEYCYGGIQGSDMGFSIMGDVFLKAVYVDFNIANQTIGFAHKTLEN